MGGNRELARVERGRQKRSGGNYVPSKYVEAFVSCCCQATTQIRTQLCSCSYAGAGCAAAAAAYSFLPSVRDEQNRASSVAYLFESDRFFKSSSVSERTKCWICRVGSYRYIQQPSLLPCGYRVRSAIRSRAMLPAMTIC